MLTLLEFALQNLLFIGLHLDSRMYIPEAALTKGRGGVHSTDSSGRYGRARETHRAQSAACGIYSQQELPGGSTRLPAGRG